MSKVYSREKTMNKTKTVIASFVLTASCLLGSPPPPTPTPTPTPAPIKTHTIVISNSGVVGAGVIKAGPGVIKSVTVTGGGGGSSTQPLYVQLFNATTLPPELTTAPTISLAASPLGVTQLLNYSPGDMPFDTGISVGISSEPHQFYTSGFTYFVIATIVYQ
jgi:hypothetical protein